MAKLIQIKPPAPAPASFNIFETRSRELMQKDLAKSELDEHDMFTEPCKNPPVTLEWRPHIAGAYKIPYFTLEGSIHPVFHRIKLIHLPASKAEVKRLKIGKYMSLSELVLIEHNLPTIFPYLYPVHDVAPEMQGLLIITEGEKKAAKVANDWKVKTVGLGGINMWHNPTDNPRAPKVLNTMLAQYIYQQGFTRCILITDDDIYTRVEHQASWASLRDKLMGRFPSMDVIIKAPPTGVGKVDDWLANFEGRPEDLEDIEGIEHANDVVTLIGEYGLIPRQFASERRAPQIEANMENAFRLISRHPMLKDRWRLNEDAGVVELEGEAAEESHAYADVQGVLQKYMHMGTIGAKPVYDAILRVAGHNKYSPAREDIMACGSPDGEDWFNKLFGYLGDQGEAIIRALVCGYVKRVLEPGCDWRIMAILSGKNKIGKSGLARWVTGTKRRVYTIQKGQLGIADKDTPRRMMQPGITLFDDIDTFSGVEKGKLKALVTQTHDISRRAFGHFDQYAERRGVLMGTTNETYIIPDDPTGNTRFAAVHIPEKFDFEALNTHRKKVIALARGLVEEGYEPDDINFEAQQAFVEESLIREKIGEFLECLKEGTFKASNVDLWQLEGVWYFKASKFWTFCNIDPKAWERKEMGSILRQIGLSYLDDNQCIRVRGVKVKNVWRFGG